MRRRGGQNHVLLYLLLNVIVSAATVLAVLVVWDRVRQKDMPPEVPTSVVSVASATVAPVELTATPEAPATPGAEVTPTQDGPVIEIAAVIGATDPEQEYVLLKRVGDGDVSLAGWQLKDEDGNVYTFPSSPELILYKDGAVQVYTRVGNDTPTEVYWNRIEPVWRPGEWVTLVDNQGKVQASAQAP
jgi:hypothetical protein